jgi:hypothetical protein
MTKRAKFFEIVSNIFDFQRNRTGKSILLFLSGFVTLTWLVTSAISFVNLSVKWLLQKRGYNLVDNIETTLRSAAVDILLSVALFAIAFLFMWRNYKRNTQEGLLTVLDSPSPHRGLIVMLGPYNPKGSSLTSVADIADCADLAAERFELLKSNWGTLIVAVQHHGEQLEHCWVVCTKSGSADQFNMAEKVIKGFAKKNVECHKVVINDGNDISLIVPRISHIYHEAAFTHNLEANQIIADFTGGTAAMSGGMILATVEEDRKIEYVRQDKPLIVGNQALTPADIAGEKILVMVRTTPALLPVVSAKRESP